MDESRSPETLSIRPNKLVSLRQRVMNRLRHTPEQPQTLHPNVLTPPEREVDVINGQEYPIRISARDASYEFTSEDWATWLGNNDKKVASEPKEVKRNAGILMQEFVQGIYEMYEEHISRGNEFPTRPQVFYQLPGNSAASQKDGTIISITRDYLLAKARQPIDSMQTDFGTFTDRETPHFVGTPRQDMRSCGVHETDHAQWQQTHQGFERDIVQIPEGGYTKARYDSDPVELRALREQLLHAQRSGYESNTIATFQKRITAAEQYQINQAKNAAIVARAKSSS